MGLPAAIALQASLTAALLISASLALGMAAFIALFRFRAGVVPVIAACAAAGLLRALAA